MTRFNVYLKEGNILVADAIEWEEFICEYGWNDGFYVVSFDEATNI